MSVDWYGLVLTLEMSNADLVEIMRSLRRIRSSGDPARIVCSIHGFDDDPRELWNIPEVQSFCRRLIDIGFISDLEFAPHWEPDLSGTPGQGGLGAVEIWLMAEGRFGQTLELDANVLAEASLVVTRANARADEVLLT